MSSERYEDDDGTITALLDRSRRRIPTLQAMRERLQQGETLSSVEVVELQKIFDSANDTRALVDRHPELHDLVMKMIALYSEITELALANEEKQQPQ